MDQTQPGQRMDGTAGAHLLEGVASSEITVDRLVVPAQGCVGAALVVQGHGAPHHVAVAVDQCEGYLEFDEGVARQAYFCQVIGPIDMESDLRRDVTGALGGIERGDVV